MISSLHTSLSVESSPVLLLAGSWWSALHSDDSVFSRGEACCTLYRHTPISISVHVPLGVGTSSGSGFSSSVERGCRNFSGAVLSSVGTGHTLNDEEIVYSYNIQSLVMYDIVHVLTHLEGAWWRLWLRYWAVAAWPGAFVYNSRQLLLWLLLQQALPCRQWLQWCNLCLEDKAHQLAFQSLNLVSKE